MISKLYKLSMNGESYEKTYDKFGEKYIKFRRLYNSSMREVDKQMGVFDINNVIILNVNLSGDDVKVYGNLRIFGDEKEIKKTEENIKENKFKLEEIV